MTHACIHCLQSETCYGGGLDAGVEVGSWPCAPDQTGHFVQTLNRDLHCPEASSLSPCATLSHSLCLTHSSPSLSLPFWISVISVTDRPTDHHRRKIASFAFSTVSCSTLSWIDHAFSIMHIYMKIKTKARCLTEGRKIFKVKIKIYLQQECRYTRVWASTIILCWAMLFKQGV